MRKLIVAVACLGLFAAVANAANIEYYFSLQGDVSGTPAEYTAQETLTVDPGQTVYIWAQIDAGDVWNSCNALFLNGTDLSIMSPAVTEYQADFSGVLFRWEAGSVDPLTDELFVVGVTSQGAGAPLGDSLSVGDQWLLAEVAFEDFGYAYGVHMANGEGGSALRGGTQEELIYFGFGDDPVLNGALGSPGAYSELADIFVTPDRKSVV